MKYLGYTVSRYGVRKGNKVDEVLQMPQFHSISGINVILLQILRYFASLTELSYKLTGVKRHGFGKKIRNRIFNFET